jgi:splicing factor U2AF subunit
VDDRSIDKAIKALNNLEFKDKKLRIQRASQHSKNAGLQAAINMYKNVPDDKKLPIPLFTMNPSRVVQFLNMISVEDLYEEDELM